MSGKRVSVMIAAFGLLAGCVAIYPEVDQQYGYAVTAAREAQTFNPQAGRSARVVSGIDGLAAKATVDRYVESFKSPPPVANVLNIGGGLTSQTGQ